MNRYVLGFVALVAAHSYGTANACQGAWVANGSGDPPIVTGNIVDITLTGWQGDLYYIDGSLAGSLHTTGQFTISVNLSYGAHSVHSPRYNCSQDFTVVAPPTAGPGLNTVYRFYKQWGGTTSDHWSTLDFNEGSADIASTYEGVFFATHPSPLDANMTPLYRCLGWYAGGDHFADTDSNCGGHTNEGSYGYISTISRPGYVPLYRFVRSPPWDAIDTTNWNEVINWNTHGYVVLGYVPQ